MNTKPTGNPPPKSPPFSKPAIELISQRYSCRTYQRRVLETEIQSKLGEIAASTGIGPFGHEARFELLAASEQDPHRLRSLGTYGFISGASAYLVGAMERDRFSPEDFGYLLEKLILYATDLGLGTCWLGGSFTKSSFARKINARSSELVPAVSAVGYIAERPRRIETWLKSRRGIKTRKPWSQLFFDHRFGRPLTDQGLDGYHLALEMVRLAPSASNRQPWRVVKYGNQYHFYLQRTPGYRENLLTRLTTVADLQRLDMGIALCHFELTAAETGLAGGWQIRDPQIELPDENIEYTISWVV